MSLSAAFHKPSNDNTDVNETIVAETKVEIEEENTAEVSTNTETIAIRDEQSSSANSTVIPINPDASVGVTSNNTADQEKTDTIEDQNKSTEAGEEIYVLNTSDLKIDAMTDYAHYGDSIYLGNDEGLTLTITINKSDALPDDLFFYYDESLLDVDISEPIYIENKTRIKAYVTAHEECEAELMISTIYELETLKEEARAIIYNIRKLDSEEGRVIYVTPTGSKYHFDSDCAGENAIAMTYYDAEIMEIDPCGKCVN